MSARQRLLLSPYRLPTRHQVLLNQDDMAAWLNGYVALWHPALLATAAAVPRVDSPYDHESPGAGCAYAIPESPPLFQPDDWPRRVRAAGAIHFTCTASRAGTVANLTDALRGALAEPAEGQDAALPAAEVSPLLALPPEALRPFFGLALGYLFLDVLFEAMEHDPVLQKDVFWASAQAAARALLPGGDGESASREHLLSAAQQLATARDMLYPSPIHLVDIALLDEARPAAELAEVLRRDAGPGGAVLNLIASATALENLKRDEPEALERFRRRAEGDSPSLEVCGAVFREREDALLPVESQLWNLRRGRTVTRDLIGRDVTVHARRRTAFQPQSPVLLQAAGLRLTVLLAFDSAVVPTYRGPSVSWPSPSGRQVSAFARQPLPAHEAQSFFNLVHHLREALQLDTAPTLAFRHDPGQPPAPFYDDFHALQALAPVFGQWIGLSRFLDEALAGEYTSASAADEFMSDYLEERVNARLTDPVSGFARHVRSRRRLEAAWAFLAIFKSLGGTPSGDAEADLAGKLTAAEDEFESAASLTEEKLGGLPSPGRLESPLAGLEEASAKLLAGRLLARGNGGPGFLLLNPCSFKRLVAVELPGFVGIPPTGKDSPVKAAQIDGGIARLVVEVPALGFAWVPKPSRQGPPMHSPIKSADGTTVRNQFFEAEIDPQTGGIKALRDLQFRVNRLMQALVYNPGSTMEARSVAVTAVGAALGEVTAEGVLLDERREVLAEFRQRFRAWAQRPVLEIRIDLTPKHAPSGYPWHAYYGCRVGYRGQSSALFRGVNHSPMPTYHPRPCSPEFVEAKLGREGVQLYTCGLPFVQKSGRALDVILAPEGETATSFDLAVGLDGQHPALLAQGLVTPVTAVPADFGPPHVGPSGWLFHLDMPNLLLTSLRPVVTAGRLEPGIIAHLAECSTFGGPAELRCVRDPVRAAFLDGEGNPVVDAGVGGDAVMLSATAGDFLRLRVDFG